MATPLDIVQTLRDIRLGLYGTPTRTLYNKGPGMIAMGGSYSALCHVSPTFTWPAVSGASFPRLLAVQASCGLA